MKKPLLLLLVAVTGTGLLLAPALLGLITVIFTASASAAQNPCVTSIVNAVGGPVRLPVTGAFFYVQGARPITDFVQDQLQVSESGCLVVDSEFRTTLPGVYAVGDVLCNHIKQAVIAAAEGAIAAMAVDKELHGRKQMAVDWAK